MIVLLNHEAAVSFVSFCLTVARSLAASIAATENTDFSGSYTLTKIKGGNFGLGPKKGNVWSLDVTQTSTGLEVTRVRDNQRFINTFSLDGTEGVYKDPHGTTGSCKGHF